MDKDRKSERAEALLAVIGDLAAVGKQLQNAIETGMVSDRVSRIRAALFCEIGELSENCEPPTFGGDT